MSETEYRAKKAVIRGINPDVFRCGQNAEVIGIYFVVPHGEKERLCFQLRYNDGFVGLVPISECGYELNGPGRYKTIKAGDDNAENL